MNCYAKKCLFISNGMAKTMYDTPIKWENKKKLKGKYWEPLGKL